jgi:hypothetical protein
MTDFSAARLSDHARTAMARRRVSEAQVHEVLRAPRAVVPATGRDASWCKAPWCWAIRRRGLFCAWSSKWVLDPPEVVTVYATTQFRRYGAKP